MKIIQVVAVLALFVLGLASAPARAVDQRAASKSAASTKQSKAAGPLNRSRAKSIRRQSKIVLTRHFVPARPSFGELQGLHSAVDSLELRSGVALVVDQDTSEVLFSKNSSAVLPIASITKLMTGLVVVESAQSLDELLTITQSDVDTEKGSRSRLAVGTQLTRGEMMHLALMSSENRAAHALGRYFEGGVAGMVAAMNRKAKLLGMKDTHYAEPTGLSSQNQSSANDLARLVVEAHKQPLLRELTTSQEAQVPVGRRFLQFRNTNGLVRDPQWTIGLQKTGYISEAGRCVVMQARMAGRTLVMVLLDSAGKFSRIGDAERIRRWLDGPTMTAAHSVQPVR